MLDLQAECVERGIPYMVFLKEKLYRNEGKVKVGAECPPTRP